MEENIYCKQNKEHRLYHAIGEKCPCYVWFINKLGTTLAAPLARSVDYQALGRSLFEIERFPDED